MSGHYQISARQGERHKVNFHLPREAGWRSLALVTPLAQIKATAAATTAVAVLDATVDADNDLIALVLSSTENNKLTPGQTYEWDLRLSWGDGDVNYPVSGTVNISPSVSRP